MIEEFIDKFGSSIQELMEQRINRSDIRVFVSPFVFDRLKTELIKYYQSVMIPGDRFWTILDLQHREKESLTLFGVTFSPSEGWPYVHMLISFRNAEHISGIRPIKIYVKKWTIKYE